MTNIGSALYFKEILQMIRPMGRPQEVLELMAVLRMLASVPAGRRILDKIMNLNHTIPLRFSATKRNSLGDFAWRTKTVSIARIGTNVPGMSDSDRSRATALMAQVLAHELQHAITLASVEKMEKAAQNRDELVLALRLSEASAYFEEGLVRKDLVKKYPQLDEIYVYHDPKDPPGTMRAVDSKDDPRFIKYGGRILKRLYTKEDKIDEDADHFVRDALAGKNKSVNGSVEGDLKDMPMRRQGTRADFIAGMGELLRGMNANVSCDELLKNLPAKTPVSALGRFGAFLKRQLDL